MNLRDLLMTRMRPEQIGILLRFADWVVANPGKPLTDSVVEWLGYPLPIEATRSQLHEALHAVGGIERIDFGAKPVIEWPRAQEVLRYPRAAKAPAKPRGKSKTSASPDELAPEDWQKLWERIWKTRPWLIAPGQSERMRHCSPRWVKQQVDQCLSHFRAKGEPRADWVATAWNWIQKADAWALEKIGADIPSAAAFHRLAEENPVRFMPEVLR